MLAANELREYAPVATIPPGARVSLKPRERERLTFPPASADDLVVAVHPHALKAPTNRLTLAALMADDDLSWVGAVDEFMLVLDAGSSRDPRPIIRRHLLRGPMLWAVIRPGLLTQPEAERPLHTVYDGDRPWVVVGQNAIGAPIAVPLNDARGRPKWWAPTLQANDLLFAGSKNSKVELNHLWSFDGCSSVVGEVATTGRQKLSVAIASYFK